VNLDQARTILSDHSRSKRNGIFPEKFSHEGKLTNPLCGDHVEIKILTDHGKIQDIGFKTVACAICSASTSLIASQVKGMQVEVVLEMGNIFERSILEREDMSWPVEILSYSCFEHLRVNPSRRMCALLPWVALKKAFKVADIRPQYQPTP
jgi:nitrogen fixation NifU-like protein